MVSARTQEVAMLVGLATFALAAPFEAVPAPNGRGDLDQLGSVLRMADGSVWAVGTTGQGNASIGFTAWFDGGAWIRNSVPRGRYDYDRVTDVAEVAPGVVWAVGYSSNQ